MSRINGNCFSSSKKKNVVEFVGGTVHPEIPPLTQECANQYTSRRWTIIGGNFWHILTVLWAPIIGICQTQDPGQDGFQGWDSKAAVISLHAVILSICHWKFYYQQDEIFGSFCQHFSWEVTRALVLKMVIQLRSSQILISYNYSHYCLINTNTRNH